MYSLPRSKNVDLKSATGVKNEFAKLTIVSIWKIKFTHIFRWTTILFCFIYQDDVKRIAANKDPATSGVYNKGNAMRYDLEDQHLKRLREFAPKNC